MTTLNDSLAAEIERCEELLGVYKQIPQGAFGASIIRSEIEFAKRALSAQDAAYMVKALTALRGCN